MLVDSSRQNRNQRFYLQQRKQIIRHQKIERRLYSRKDTPEVQLQFYQEVQYLVQQTYFKNLQIYPGDADPLKHCQRRLLAFLAQETAALQPPPL